MQIQRLTTIEEPTNFLIGDKINIDHYTATCQEITPKGALFLMDQYLDKPMAMNRNNSNKGGYEESDLRRALQSEDILKIFSCIREWMVPFDNGDLLRIPFAGEMFGDMLSTWVEPDGHEQWPLMRDRRNCIASRCGEYEWGWLQNKGITSSTIFCVVDLSGYAAAWDASYVLGVRPAFQIATYREEAETCHS